MDGTPKTETHKHQGEQGTQTQTFWSGFCSVSMGFAGHTELFGPPPLHVKDHHLSNWRFSGLEKGVFWKGVFSKMAIFWRESLEILESLQSVENNGESDHLLEILQNVEVLGIPRVKRPLS